MDSIQPITTIFLRGTANEVLDCAVFIRTVHGIIDSIRLLESGAYSILGRVPRTPVSEEMIVYATDEAVEKFIKTATIVAA